MNIQKLEKIHAVLGFLLRNLSIIFIISLKSYFLNCQYDLFIKER